MSVCSASTSSLRIINRMSQLKTTFELHLLFIYFLLLLLLFLFQVSSPKFFTISRKRINFESCIEIPVLD